MKEVEILSLLWSEKNFLFFCEETKRRKKTSKMAAKTKKIQKICSFCSFFALWTGDRNTYKFLDTFTRTDILYISLV